jgi:electron transfer flavoprotein alpha subunit
LEHFVVASIYGPDEESKSIWVCLEINEGKLASVSLELLSKGRELADKVGWSLTGLLLGDQVSSCSEEVYTHGADEVWIVDHPLLQHFTIEAYAKAAYTAIMQGKPSVLLFGATPNSRDLAGRLAVRLKTGLNADCTNLRIDPDRGILISEVTGFGGGIIAYLEAAYHRPQMATVRPGVFGVKEYTGFKIGTPKEIQVELPEEIIKTKVLDRVIGETLDLTQAETLICGGRGVAGDFKMLQELAELLQGDVGATRPPVDEGHIERERQIGQTGVMGHPKLAIACGISGAFHFVVGIQDADTIIAINSDPEAPIFEFADYCIVGDVFEILPALIRALRNEKAAAHA